MSCFVLVPGGSREIGLCPHLWIYPITDHDTIIIKPTLEQYNDPRLDHPCPSVLNIFYRQNKKKKEADFY
jgi:hypothetical protein